MKIREKLNPTIFISYSHDDIKIVEKIANKLKGHYDIWIDFSEIHAKEVFTKEIAIGIQNCELFISVISKSYINKPFCQEELAYAKKKEKEKLPFYIEPIVFDAELDFTFGNRESELRTDISYHDVDNVDEFVKKQCDKLMESLKQYFYLSKLRINKSYQAHLKDLNIDYALLKSNYEKFSGNGYFEHIIYEDLYPSFEIIKKQSIENSESIEFEKYNKSLSVNNNQLLIKYIEEKYNKHIVLYGDGGSGKTIAVKQIHDYYLKKKIPVLYVPLNKVRFCDEDGSLEKYIKDNISGQVNWSIIRQLATYDVYDMRVILILDGFNEITNNTLKATNQIAEIMGWRNIQVILTSRNDCTDIFTTTDIDKIKTLKLLPLTENKIISHILNKNIDISLISPELLNLLSNPFMLILYTEADITEIYSGIIRNKTLYQYFVLDVSEKPNTNGKIIYNYLISQLYKKVEEHSLSILECFLSIELALPLLAFLIVQSNDSTKITINYFIEQLNATIANSEISNNYMNSRVIDIQASLNINISDFNSKCVALVVNCVLRELSLVNEKNGELEFAHQTFRDFFAGLFLSKQIERLVPKKKTDDFMSRFVSQSLKNISNDAFPKFVLSNSLYSDDVLKFCSVILEEEKAMPTIMEDTILYPGKPDLLKCSNYSYVEKVLNSYKYQEGIDAQNAVSNLISILAFGRNNNLSNCDFSMLDLRKSRLGGIDFTDWINDKLYPSSFNNSIIDIKCFIPQTHHATIKAMHISNDGSIYTIDNDGIINVWKQNISEPLKSFNINIDGEILGLAVSSGGKKIAVLTHQTIYVYDTTFCTIKLYNTTHFYKSIRFNSNDAIEVTYDIKPLTWKNISEAYRFNNEYDFPASASVVSPDGSTIIKSIKTNTYFDIENQCYQNFVQLIKLEQIDSKYISKTYSTNFANESGNWKIKKVVFSPNGEQVLFCVNSYVILLETKTMKEIRRARYNAMVNDVDFINSETIIIAIGASLLYLDLEFNSISIISGYKIKNINQVFFCDGTYWALSKNNRVIKFNENMNVERKRKISAKNISKLAYGKNLETREHRFFYIQNEQCFMYDFYRNEIEPVITNYQIAKTTIDSVLLPYQIYLMKNNMIRIVDKNDPINIRVYKNYDVFNVYGCDFRNIRGDIKNYTDIIQQEGGIINDLF